MPPRDGPRTCVQPCTHAHWLWCKVAASSARIARARRVPSAHPCTAACKPVAPPPTLPRTAPGATADERHGVHIAQRHTGACGAPPGAAKPRHPRLLPGVVCEGRVPAVVAVGAHAVRPMCIPTCTSAPVQGNDTWLPMSLVASCPPAYLPLIRPRPRPAACRWQAVPEGTQSQPVTTGHILPSVTDAASCARVQVVVGGAALPQRDAGPLQVSKGAAASWVGGWAQLGLGKPHAWGRQSYLSRAVQARNRLFQNLFFSFALCRG